MSIRPTLDGLRARPLRSWALDVFVALATAALTVPFAFEHPQPRPLWPAILLEVVLLTAVLFRRIWPVGVFWWIFALSVVTAIWHDKLTSGFAGPVALYTLAAQRPRRQALWTAGVLEVGALIEAGITGNDRGWAAAITASALIGIALALGLYNGTRRAYLGELEDRAARLEREREQANELAAAAERARIAREMHDIVAHHLTVMVALSDGAAAAAARNPEQAAEAMRTVSATGRDALRDTRRLLGVLADDGVGETGERRPVPGLSDLDALVEQVRSAGLGVDYSIEGVGAPMPTDAQLTVYRLVQEALTNTMKHAHPGSRATVAMRFDDDGLRLDVTDDGAGVVAPGGWRPGRGMTGMRARVAAVGGRWEAGPADPTGWHVSVTLPLAERSGGVG